MNRLGECTCGHIGGATNTEHEDTEEPGHGSCKKCDCEKYTWKRYLSMTMDEISRSLGQILSRAGDTRGHVILLSDEEMEALKSAIKLVRMQ